MQISPFGASSLTRHSTRISAHSGGYSRAYHVVSIPTVMARPKQRGVLAVCIFIRSSCIKNVRMCRRQGAGRHVCDVSAETLIRAQATREIFRHAA
jgi:hypothetical protein